MTGSQGRFVGRYAVTGVLGSGSFGTVYLGIDPGTGGPVAVKVLDRGGERAEQLRMQLHAEADAMRRVDDVHCLRVREVIDEPGLAAVVTDFVGGAPLREVLRRYGRLTGPQALVVLRGALAGLVAVHAAGLLHGDLKPDNVLVEPDGNSRLIDFGLAGPVHADADEIESVVGSPAYLSPEQIRGAAPDARSDVYACAVMLFELLCGQRPYSSLRMTELLALHVSAPVPDPRSVDASVDAGLAQLCVAGMAKDPALRPQTAAQFLAALEHAARERYGPQWATAGAGVGGLVGGLLASGGSVAGSTVAGSGAAVTSGTGGLVGGSAGLGTVGGAATPISGVVGSGTSAPLGGLTGGALQSARRARRPIREIFRLGTATGKTAVVLVVALVVAVVTLVSIAVVHHRDRHPVAGHPPRSVPSGRGSSSVSHTTSAARPALENCDGQRSEVPTGLHPRSCWALPGDLQAKALVDGQIWFVDEGRLIIDDVRTGARVASAPLADDIQAMSVVSVGGRSEMLVIGLHPEPETTSGDKAWVARGYALPVTPGRAPNLVYQVAPGSQRESDAESHPVTFGTSSVFVDDAILTYGADHFVAFPQNDLFVNGLRRNRDSGVGYAPVGPVGDHIVGYVADRFFLTDNVHSLLGYAGITADGSAAWHTTKVVPSENVPFYEGTEYLSAVIAGDIISFAVPDDRKPANSVTFRSASTGAVVARPDPSQLAGQPVVAVSPGEFSTNGAMVASADGRYLAVAGNENGTAVADVATGTVMPVSTSGTVVPTVADGDTAYGESDAGGAVAIDMASGKATALPDGVYSPDLLTDRAGFVAGRGALPPIVFSR